MKRYVYVKSNYENENDYTNSDIVKLLNEHGIDTTKAQYELKAEAYERYGSGSVYIKKFKCPGDWLAYWSMLFHTTPNASAFSEEGYTLADIEEYIDAYPDVESMRKQAEMNWWGDGDDYIIYLKNLTTGEYLTGPNEDYYEEDEEDWED